MSKQAMIYKRVLISGAGIGGMALATALARRGIEVQVVERRQQASAIGVGIIQHCNAVRVLQSLSLLQDCQDSTPPPKTPSALHRLLQR